MYIRMYVLQVGSACTYVWVECACTHVLVLRTYIKHSAGVAYEAVICDDVDEGQVVPHSTLVVIEVMGWSDLHST